MLPAYWSIFTHSFQLLILLMPPSNLWDYLHKCHAYIRQSTCYTHNMRITYPCTHTHSIPYTHIFPTIRPPKITHAHIDPHSAVKLKYTGEEGSTYINANYIRVSHSYQLCMICELELFPFVCMHFNL